jgi:hypothetical protein
VGFLLLSERDSGSLKARKSFYNLSRRQYLFEKPRDLDEGIWFLCGFADEATAERGPAGGFARVTTFGGACGAGRVNQEHLVGSFDYLDFEVAYSGASGPPRDFRGFSGGGLWQVPVIRTLDGTLKVKELLFSGVAFYQHAPQESHRRIKCHGRRSIYDQVVQSIEDAS